MPFKSVKQRKFLFARHPRLARKWVKKYGSKIQRSKTHNFSILYRAGLPILQAFRACQSGLIGNKVVERAVGAIEEEVKAGSTITEAMHRQAVFPALLIRMTSVGETSGNLDKALVNVSDYYNQVIPRRIKEVFAVAEPLLMVVLIFIVGCVALAIYLPIIALMGAIR